MYDTYFVDYEDSSLAGILIIVVTAPTSFLFSPVGDTLGLFDPDTIAGEVLLWPSCFCPD